MADEVKNLKGSGKPTVEDRLALMEEALEAQRAENATLQAMLKIGAVNPHAATDEQASIARQAAIRAEVDKGYVQRTQEACDKQFPNGKHRWACVLEDGNCHPKIVVGADNEVDAAARYMASCGIKSAEKAVTVVRA